MAVKKNRMPERELSPEIANSLAQEIANLIIAFVMNDFSLDEKSVNRGKAILAELKASDHIISVFNISLEISRPRPEDFEKILKKIQAEKNSKGGNSWKN